MYARIVRAGIEREEKRQKENAMKRAHRVCIERCNTTNSLLFEMYVRIERSVR